VFRELLETNINLKISLKTEAELEEAVYDLTTSIQQAAWQATPPHRERHSHLDCPELVQNMLREKRAAREKWQKSRAPRDKQTYNRLAKELKQLLITNRNSSFQQFLTNLTPTVETNYSLWKATRKLKRPQQHIPPYVNQTIPGRGLLYRKLRLSSNRSKHSSVLIHHRYLARKKKPYSDNSPHLTKWQHRCEKFAYKRSNISYRETPIQPRLQAMTSSQENF
jgi:hypothetical protein